MNFNLTHFKQRKRSDIAPNEMANYDSFMKKSSEPGKTDVIVVFDSAASLVEHFFHNVSEAGGNGTWKTGSSGIGHKNDFDRTNYWKFGRDFDTFSKTISALNSGKTLLKYVTMLEAKKHELYQKFPELYKLSETAIVRKRRRAFKEDGDELDIDRYMVGDPAMWSSMPRQQVRSRAATFYIDVYGTAGVSTETLMDSVITASALVDIVEKAGIPTEIVVGATVNRPTHGTHLVNVCCKAKHADEPLDVERLLSFSLTGFFRSLLFCAWVNVSEGRNEIGGLGNGRWSFDGSPEYFSFFNAIVKTRPADSYWTGDQMEVNINNIKNFLQ